MNIPKKLAKIHQDLAKIVYKFQLQGRAEISKMRVRPPKPKNRKWDYVYIWDTGTGKRLIGQITSVPAKYEAFLGAYAAEFIALRGPIARNEKTKLSEYFFRSTAEWTGERWEFNDTSKSWVGLGDARILPRIYKKKKVHPLDMPLKLTRDDVEEWLREAKRNVKN